MSPGPRLTSIPSVILIYPAVWPHQTWAENGGVVPFFWGDLGPHVTQCGLGRVLPLYQLASCSTQTFCHNRHRPKNRGGCCALFGGWGGAGSQSNTTLPELRPTSVSSGILIYLAIWPQWTWTENGGGSCAFFGGGAGSTSNIMWPGPLPPCRVSS